MAPRRTGTLVPKASGFFGRLRLTLPNGAEERRWINLQTKDRTTARRKLTRMVALLEAGELVAEAQVKAAAPETYQAYSSDLHKRRLALGIVMAAGRRFESCRACLESLGFSDAAYCGPQ